MGTPIRLFRFAHIVSRYANVGGWTLHQAALRLLKTS
jgi:hypothetical protein